MKEEMLQPKKRRRSRPAKKPSGFQCSFCGCYTSKSDEYYSSLTTILINRFIELLNSNNGQTYFDGVMDSIHAVFGTKNPVIRSHLELVGYLEKYEQRFGIQLTWEDQNIKES